MPSPQSATEYERLTPIDRDDVVATFGPSDCLTFVESVKNDHPDTFDQVVDHLTHTLWAGGAN